MRAFLAKLFACRCPIQTVAAKDYARIRPPGPQVLGPKQLAWCETHFPFYGIHRAQAEAPTGVSVVHPKGVEA